MRPAVPPVPPAFTTALTKALSVDLPDEVCGLYDEPPAGSGSVLYRPDLSASDPMSMAAALAALARSAHVVPPNLLPLAPVDDRSLAVVVCQVPTLDRIPGTGLVLRWHLDDIPAASQAAVLDVDARSYVTSVLEELDARSTGLDRMAVQAAKYRREYLQKGVRPKTYVTRPVQLACQNVVVGLAAFAHQASFDALGVPLWQTCEVPHLATHEGVRALTALMLCDAFQSGGTMEVRFGKHPERAVPAALRRYARVLGIDVGHEDPAVITPQEARELFLAVTPMSDHLRARATAAFDAGALTPERLCFTLLAGVWRDLEVDFLLATTPRAPQILAGGADVADRTARAAETEIARAALLAGTLHRRLDGVDTAGQSGQVRVFEDTHAGVTWEVQPEVAAVLYRGAAGPLPWLPSGAIRTVTPGQDLLVLPRAHPTEDDVEIALQLADDYGALVGLVVPADRADFVSCLLPVLRSPDTVAELDKAIEAKLLTSQLSRA